MDGPVKILRRDWPAVNHREKHPYGSMDLDSTLTAADPLLFRDLGRSASLYRPFPPNARPHPLLHPCFLRAPLSQLRCKYVSGYDSSQRISHFLEKSNPGSVQPRSHFASACFIILEFEDFGKIIGNGK